MVRNAFVVSLFARCNLLRMLPSVAPSLCSVLGWSSARDDWLDMADPWQLKLFHLYRKLEEVVQTVSFISIFLIFSFRVAHLSH